MVLGKYNPSYLPFQSRIDHTREIIIGREEEIFRITEKVQRRQEEL